MKKIFVMLTFLIGCSAGMMGQVTIGSVDDPHPGAVLDLQSTSQGLLLPRIALTGAADFLIEGSDKDAAKGMLVYNTSDKMEGPGLYVWTGTAWRSFAAVDCPIPAQPNRITFSPALTNTIMVNTLITVTAGLASGGTSYKWAVPEGFEIVGEATTKSISLRAKQTGDFDAAQITVKAVNSCGESEATTATGTITVAEPGSAPAIPTLALTSLGTYLAPGDQFTITCGDVGADSYIWTLPAGITATSTTTTANAITVTVAEGIYMANTIKVKASNGMGDSGERTGSGGPIVARICSDAPRDPYIIPFQSSRVEGSTFSVNLVVYKEGVTSYKWTLPPGLSFVSGDSTQTVTVRCDKAGNYQGSDIKVKVTNDCGFLNTTGSGAFSVVSKTGVKGVISGFNGTYTTYKYPNGLGTWMTQNSKEGNPAIKNSPGQEAGARGYYYRHAEIAQGCVDGWVVPTNDQFNALWAYLRTLTETTEQNESWFTQEALAGLGDGRYWDQGGYFRSGPFNSAFTTSAIGTYATVGGVNTTTGYSIRCIKNTCDEAPVNLRFRHILPSMVPPNGIDTIWVAYSSFEPNPTVTWNMQSGATILASTDSTVVLQYSNTPGTFSWDYLSCTVTNSCGSTRHAGSGVCTIASSAGSLSEELVIGVNTYRTYNVPGLGTFMLDCLREQPATYTDHPLNPGGAHGFYYNYEQSLSACPSGWVLPSAYQIATYQSFILAVNNPVISEIVQANSIYSYRDTTPRTDGFAAHLWLEGGEFGSVGLARGLPLSGGGINYRAILCVKHN